MSSYTENNNRPEADTLLIPDSAVDALFESDYCVIDILPKQVPKDSGGRYFAVEEFYLEHPRIEELYRKFANIILKLNCYFNLFVSDEGADVKAFVIGTSSSWSGNPDPALLMNRILSLADDPEDDAGPDIPASRYLNIIIESAASVSGFALLALNRGDTNMTLYNAGPDLTNLVRALAESEGLFVFTP